MSNFIFIHFLLLFLPPIAGSTNSNLEKALFRQNEEGTWVLRLMSSLLASETASDDNSQVRGNMPPIALKPFNGCMSPLLTGKVHCQQHNPICFLTKVNQTNEKVVT